MNRARLPRMRRVVIVVLCMAIAGLLLSTLRADEPDALYVVRSLTRDAEPWVPGEVIVAFGTTYSQSLADRAIRDAGGASARRSQFGGHYLITLADGVGVPEAVARLRAMPEVEYAEPNGIVRACFTPNDRYYQNQWHMKLIGAERAWDIQKGDPSVVVAVIDSGVAFEDYGVFRKAPDWGNASFATGYNTFTRDSHANDDNYHGTHVASTIAEATNNGDGASGLCFGCGIMPVKVLNASGVGSFFNVAEGVDYAVNYTQGGTRPVKVINLSLGGDTESTTLRSAIDRAVAAGVVVVAAAGNDGKAIVGFPASLANVIAVGAVDGRKQLTPYSNYGTALDVVAPGGDLDRDDDKDGYPDGVLQQTFSPTAAKAGRYDQFGYYFVEGTSQATPHVAALAALLMRQGITDPVAVKKAIESTAEDLGAPGRDDRFGYGLIRPAEALKGLGINK
jgi:serine protease